MKEDEISVSESECFADDCTATTLINEVGLSTAIGWATQADQSRYACPKHVSDLRRLLERVEAGDV